MLSSLAVGAGLLGLVALRDRTQRTHTIVANFPLIGRFRYWLETLGPPLRQYLVTSNDEERPFTRDQRRWVYASSKKENNYFGFGTDNPFEQSPGYIFVRHAAFPFPAPHAGQPGYDPNYTCRGAKILGGHRRRKHAFRPTSIINVSAMSYGSLSGPAVEAINRGVVLAGAMQNTGEGGICDFHRKGGDLVWQIGTGYFGARDERGRFSIDRFLETVQSAKVRAIEIKLSQGAKPGLGGVLPAAKITPEIAKIRLIPLGQDCISPASHSAFHDVDSMLDFIERIADATGLPVGIKSAVGKRASGVRWPIASRRRDARRTSSPSTAAKAAPEQPHSHSPTTYHCHFDRVFPRFTKSSRRAASPKRSSSSELADSAFRKRRSQPSPWAAT